MNIIKHIGKKCPKGYKEIPGSMHLGKGIWALQCQREELPSLYKRIPIKKQTEANKVKQEGKY